MGYEITSKPLLWLNVAMYIILWILTALRIFFFPQKLLADLKNHSVGVGLFTLVAGSCVLGSQFAVLIQAYAPAAVLLCVGFVLWVVLIYFVFTLITVNAEKPDLQTAINGVWLVSIVATQSVSILSCLMVPAMAFGQQLLLFFAFCMFLLGGMLYFLIIMLIFYRFLFFVLKPEALGPPHRINMGAAAIPKCFIFAALLAWALTFMGLLKFLIRSLLPQNRS